MAAFAITVFLGALLIFQVQPILGRFILPWFGGGPGVWTTCLLFFQLLLLGGYAYAHGLPRWLRLIGDGRECPVAFMAWESPSPRTVKLLAEATSSHGPVSPV